MIDYKLLSSGSDYSDYHGLSLHSSDWERLASAHASDERLASAHASDEMDTEPATQPYDDPRRFGRNNSGVTDSDLSDVLCILHPSSGPAIKVVNALAKRAPEHILQNKDLLEAREESDPTLVQHDVTIARSIALRMSSKVRDKTLGFVFGRLARKVDILLCDDERDKALSQQHFRIYVNSQESLMIQDMSTNGLLFDDHFLTRRKCPEAEEGRRGEYGDKRMIVSGAVLRLYCGHAEEIRFVVRIPNRQGFESAYQLTLNEYLDEVEQAEARARNPPTLPAVSDASSA